MAAGEMIDWKTSVARLQDTQDVPHDVTFTVIDSGLFANRDDSEEPKVLKVQAHKFILCLVSEVFTKMFHGSLPEDTEVEVKGCSADSFQAMIDSIYQTGNLRDVTDLHQLLELLNVVEKYQVLPIKQAVIEKMKKMDVDKMELEHILSALVAGKCFDEAFKVIEDLVLLKLKTSGIALKTIKVVNDLLSPSRDDPRMTEIFDFALKACVKGYEAALKDPCLFAKCIPEANSELSEAFQQISHYWKEKFCKNCRSAFCKNGQTVDPKGNGSMLCNVKILGSTRKWRIYFNSLIPGEVGNEFSTILSRKNLLRKDFFMPTSETTVRSKPSCLICFASNLPSYSQRSQALGQLEMPPCLKDHTPSEVSTFGASCIVKDRTEEWRFEYRKYSQLTYDCDD